MFVLMMSVCKPQLYYQSGDGECTTSQTVSKSTTWLTNVCYPFQLLKKLAVSPVKNKQTKEKNFLADFTGATQ